MSNFINLPPDTERQIVAAVILYRDMQTSVHRSIYKKYNTKVIAKKHNLTQSKIYSVFNRYLSGGRLCG